MLDAFRFATLEHFFAMAERALISEIAPMTDTDDTISIEIIPIDRITVLNPRVRDAGKFAEIVDSIDKVGLKQAHQGKPDHGYRRRSRVQPGLRPGPDGSLPRARTDGDSGDRYRPVRTGQPP